MDVLVSLLHLLLPSLLHSPNHHSNQNHQNLLHSTDEQRVTRERKKRTIFDVLQIDFRLLIFVGESGCCCKSGHCEIEAFVNREKSEKKRQTNIEMLFIHWKEERWLCDRGEEKRGEEKRGEMRLELSHSMCDECWIDSRFWECLPSLFDGLKEMFKSSGGRSPSLTNQWTIERRREMKDF